jgi:prepilin-type N-terminal cleavage/methylation domain-containing protein
MEQKKTANKKGFTIAELLIVVGIIAVLVSIAIPVFRKQLEKSREAYDIYTMRQAASAAVELFYMGITDEASAKRVGFQWNSTSGTANAYAAYLPGSGTFTPDRSKVPGYGKGTKYDGGTHFFMGNEAYDPKADYTTGVIMVSIYPKPVGDRPYLVVYWKPQKATNYIGGTGSVSNTPKYGIKIYLD